MVTETFQQRFERLSREAGIPMKPRAAWGKALGVSGPMITQVLSGARFPAHKTAIRWAKRLHVTTEYLLTGAEPEPGLSEEALRLARMFDRCEPEDQKSLLRSAELYAAQAEAERAENSRNSKKSEGVRDGRQTVPGGRRSVEPSVESE